MPCKRGQRARSELLRSGFASRGARGADELNGLCWVGGRYDLAEQYCKNENQKEVVLVAQARIVVLHAANRPLHVACCA